MVRFSPVASGDSTGALRIPFSPESAGAVVVALKGSGNEAPDAIDDAYTVVAGDTLEVDPPGVLGNDVDAESDTIIAFVDDAVDGLGMGITGGFTLATSAADAGNTISFTYTAEDALGQGLPATVRVEVVDPEDADDTGEEPGECGCGTLDGGAGFGAVVGLAAVIGRRRRTAGAARAAMS